MALTISINMLYRGLPDELGVCRDRQLGRQAGFCDFSDRSRALWDSACRQSVNQQLRKKIVDIKQKVGGD
jgi:hypothetical protein